MEPLRPLEESERRRLAEARAILAEHRTLIGPVAEEVQLLMLRDAAYPHTDVPPTHENRGSHDDPEDR